jgi:hypothetical protein
MARFEKDSNYQWLRSILCPDFETMQCPNPERRIERINEM